MSLIIEVKVVPNSPKQTCIYQHGRLKCYLKSQPERGKANKELIQYFAHILGISQQMITIMSGQTRRLKKISIEHTITFEQLLHALGIEQQQEIFKK